MNEKGNALVSRFLPGQSCDELIRKYNNSDLYHKTSTMEGHRFGLIMGRKIYDKNILKL